MKEKITVIEATVTERIANYGGAVVAFLSALIPLIEQFQADATTAVVAGSEAAQTIVTAGGDAQTQIMAAAGVFMSAFSKQIAAFKKAFLG